jgi:hypothetical protein
MPLPTQKRDKVHLNPCFKVYLICLYVKSKHSRVKHSLNMNRNLVGSIYMYGRFCIKFPQSRMKGERHPLVILTLQCLDNCFLQVLSIHVDASYQVSVHLAKQFQRRRIFRYRPIRNKNCLWWPCLLTDQDKMSNDIV